MSELSVCSHAEHGPECLCNFLQEFADDSIDLDFMPQQPWVENTNLEVQGQSIGSQAAPVNAHESSPNLDFAAPITPVSNEATLSPEHAPTPAPLVAINTSDNQEPYNGDASVSPDQAEQQHQRDETETPKMPNRIPDQGTKQRPKRKYEEEPPKSIYGPPFHTTGITENMSKEERREVRKHNAAVTEAKKIWERHRNNQAAKKSRDNKQEVLNGMKTEIERLTDENDHLRHENKRLRREMRELAQRLAERAGNNHAAYYLNNGFPPGVVLDTTTPLSFQQQRHQPQFDHDYHHDQHQRRRRFNNHNHHLNHHIPYYYDPSSPHQPQAQQQHHQPMLRTNELAQPIESQAWQDIPYQRPHQRGEQHEHEQQQQQQQQQQLHWVQGGGVQSLNSGMPRSMNATGNDVEHVNNNNNNDPATIGANVNTNTNNNGMHIVNDGLLFGVNTDVPHVFLGFEDQNQNQNQTYHH